MNDIILIHFIILLKKPIEVTTRGIICAIHFPALGFLETGIINKCAQASVKTTTLILCNKPFNGSHALFTRKMSIPKRCTFTFFGSLVRTTPVYSGVVLGGYNISFFHIFIFSSGLS
jgi:hypothetical protein